MSFQRKPPGGGSSNFAKKPNKGFKPSKGFRAKARPEPSSASARDSEPSNKHAAKTPLKGGREVDARKARKVLRALENARAEALANGADLSAWENEFMGSLETRIDTYGSAFRDPHKGALEDPISNMQRVKLKEIHAKASGKERKPGFGRQRKPAGKISGAAFDDEN